MKAWITRTGAALAAGALLAVSTATPAQALTKSGTQTCDAGGGHVGLRAEQQLLGHTMHFNVGGKTHKVSQRYSYGFNSGLRMTQSWTASSESLLLSGTYGYCYYPY